MRLAPNWSASPSVRNASIRPLKRPPCTITPTFSPPGKTSFSRFSRMNLRAAGSLTSDLSFSWRKVAGGWARRS